MNANAYNYHQFKINLKYGQHGRTGQTILGTNNHRDSSRYYICRCEREPEGEPTVAEAFAQPKNMNDVQVKFIQAW